MCSGSAEQEVQFWHGMEDALKSLEAQVAAEEVLLTLQVLREGRRLIITKQFEADNGLARASELVGRAMKLMRDFPAPRSAKYMATYLDLV